MPDSIFWNSITAARKTAFDAGFYDKQHPDRTHKMEEITITLVDVLRKRKFDSNVFRELLDKIEKIMLSFKEEEKL